MQDLDEIRRQTDEIVASGVLGRSRSYSRFLQFLVQCTAEGRIPKEMEIATEVFGRGPEFDPGQDSMVRVYAHNLRQKLDNFYADADREGGPRIIIPRGEYRVMLQAGDAAGEPVETELSPRSARRRAAGHGDGGGAGAGGHPDRPAAGAVGAASCFRIRAGGPFSAVGRDAGR
jgi:hypothetical protein